MDQRLDDLDCNGHIDRCRAIHYTQPVIRSFRSKALAELWAKGRSPRIDTRLRRRIPRRLEALNAAAAPESMDIPGYDFHASRGFRPVRYTVHVNGPWCVTFEFAEGDGYRVDFEQYH